MKSRVERYVLITSETFAVAGIGSPAIVAERTSPRARTDMSATEVTLEVSLKSKWIEKLKVSQLC